MSHSPTTLSPTEFEWTRQGVRNLDKPLTKARRKSAGNVNVGQPERAMSLVGGAALTGAGLSAGNAVGLVLMLTGCALMYRGATGHCRLYEALQIDTASSR